MNFDINGFDVGSLSLDGFSQCVNDEMGLVEDIKFLFEDKYHEIKFCNSILKIRNQYYFITCFFNPETVRQTGFVGFSNYDEYIARFNINYFPIIKEPSVG